MPHNPSHTNSHIFMQQKKRRSSGNTHNETAFDALLNSINRSNTSLDKSPVEAPPRRPSEGHKAPLDNELLFRQECPRPAGRGARTKSRERAAGVVVEAESSLPGNLQNLSMGEGNETRTPNNTQAEAPVVPAMMGSRKPENTMAGGRGSPGEGLFMSKSPSILGRSDPKADEYLNFTSGRRARFASEEGQVMEYTPEAEAIRRMEEREAEEARRQEEAAQLSSQETLRSTPQNWPSVPQFGENGLYFSKEQRPKAKPSAAGPLRQAQPAAHEDVPSQDSPSRQLHAETSAAGRPQRGPRVSYPSLEVETQNLSQDAKPYQAAALRAFSRQETEDPDFDAPETQAMDADEVEEETQTISGDEFEGMLTEAQQVVEPTTPSRKRPSQSPERPRTTSSKKAKSSSARPSSPQNEKIRSYQWDKLTPAGQRKRKTLHKEIRQNWRLDISDALPQDLWILHSQTNRPVNPRDWSNTDGELLRELSFATRGRLDLAVAAMREAVRARAGGDRLEWRSDMSEAMRLVHRPEWVEVFDHEDGDSPMQDVGAANDTLAEALRRARLENEARGRQHQPVPDLPREDSARPEIPIPVKMESSQPVVPASISKHMLLTQIQSEDVKPLTGDDLIRLQWIVQQEIEARQMRAPAGHSENPFMIE